MAVQYAQLRLLIAGGADIATIKPEVLASVLYYHIIPPHAKIDAVWTEVFLRASDGAPIPTAIPEANLKFTTTG